jgi:hypothetical protein
VLSSRGVTSAPWQRLLVLGVLAAAGFTAWAWLRPYAWRPDPAAACKVEAVQVRRDRSNYWVHIHLKVLPGQRHDLLKPVRLVTSAGRELEPADTTLAGDPAAATELWYKFWLETTDLEGGLTLCLNDGTLSIKSVPGMPELAPTEETTYSTHHW